MCFRRTLDFCWFRLLVSVIVCSTNAGSSLHSVLVNLDVLPRVSGSSFTHLARAIIKQAVGQHLCIWIAK